jgi:hypothetical protein
MKIVDGKPEYRGAVDVIVKVARHEGFFSLWKGFTPYYFRLDCLVTCGSVKTVILNIGIFTNVCREIGLLFPG